MSDAPVFQPPSFPAGEDGDEVRSYALFLAVMHHGLACLGKDAVPTGAGKVIQTAMQFEDHLNGVPISDNARGRGGR